MLRIFILAMIVNVIIVSSKSSKTWHSAPAQRICSQALSHSRTRKEHDEWENTCKAGDQVSRTHAT